jgi:hypothetical protein
MGIVVAGAIVAMMSALACEGAFGQSRSGGAFGAIAMTGDGVFHVYSGELPTAEAARAEAMKKCARSITRLYGHQADTFTGCVVWVSFGNGCGAVAHGGGLAAGAGETIDEAKKQALDRCSTVSKRCRIAEAHCAGQ